MKLAYQVSPRPDAVRDNDVKTRIDGLDGLETEFIDLADFSENDTDVPEAVGAIAFDPLDHERPGVDTTYALRVVGDADSTVPINPGHISLYNLTDDITTSAIVSLVGGPTLATAQANIPRGVAATDLKDGERIYEVRVRLTSPQVDTEVVTIYSVQMVIVHTVVVTGPGVVGPGDEGFTG